MNIFPTWLLIRCRHVLILRSLAGEKYFSMARLTALGSSCKMTGDEGDEGDCNNQLAECELVCCARAELWLATGHSTLHSDWEMSLLCTEDGKLRDWQILKLPQNKPEASRWSTLYTLYTLDSVTPHYMINYAIRKYIFSFFWIKISSLMNDGELFT